MSRAEWIEIFDVQFLDTQSGCDEEDRMCCLISHPDALVLPLTIHMRYHSFDVRNRHIAERVRIDMPRKVLKTEEIDLFPVGYEPIWV